MRKILTFLLAIAALGAASPVLAHVELVRSSPAANASITAPRTVSVTFDDRVVAAFSKIELVMVGHNMRVPVTTRLSRDGKTLIGTPRGTLMKGRYRLDWTAATADGHRETGQIAFRIT